MTENFTSGFVGLVHTALALIAIITGVLVLAERPLARNRTSFHQVMGGVYVVTMLLLNSSALAIQNLYIFGPFHVAAVVSLVTVCVGVLAPLLKFNHWLDIHYSCMCWSYVGLVAALFSELISRLPVAVGLLGFGGSVFLTSVVVCILGGCVIQRSRVRFSV